MTSVRQWWTVNELAEHYGLSSRTIYDAIASGDLVAHRFGQGRGGTRIADEDRQSWEQRCKDTMRGSATPPPDFNNRLAMSELLQKHFGL